MIVRVDQPARPSFHLPVHTSPPVHQSASPVCQSTSPPAHQPTSPPSIHQPTGPSVHQSPCPLTHVHTGPSTPPSHPSVHQPTGPSVHHPRGRSHVSASAHRSTGPPVHPLAHGPSAHRSPCPLTHIHTSPSDFSTSVKNGRERSTPCGKEVENIPEERNRHKEGWKNTKGFGYSIRGPRAGPSSTSSRNC